MIIGLNMKAINHKTLGRIVCEVSVATRDPDEGWLYHSMTLGKGEGCVTLEQSSEELGWFLGAVPEIDLLLCTWGNYERQILSRHVRVFKEQGKLPESFQHVLLKKTLQYLDVRKLLPQGSLEDIEPEYEEVSPEDLAYESLDRAIKIATLAEEVLASPRTTALG